jgi:methionyl-tRNA formyltransferase
VEQKFIFIGNRFFVLEEMLRLKLNLVKILVIKNSYLQKELEKAKVEHLVINSKLQLIDEILQADFNILLANGCPYILPVSKIKKDRQEFINIHPSYLPDLRGADPQPGAILYARDSGASCHIMDDGIDTGKIISQVKIPYSPDLDVALLYQLSFMAEKEVFVKAYKNSFISQYSQKIYGNEIYYSKKEMDLKIDLLKSANEIYQTIKAFSNKSQGAYIIYKNEKYIFYDCEIISNAYLKSKIPSYQDTEIIFNYENILVIKRDDVYIKFKNCNKSISNLNVGAKLNEMD